MNGAPSPSHVVASESSPLSGHTSFLPSGSSSKKDAPGKEQGNFKEVWGGKISRSARSQGLRVPRFRDLVVSRFYDFVVYGCQVPKVSRSWGFQILKFRSLWVSGFQVLRFPGVRGQATGLKKVDSKIQGVKI